MRDLIARPWLSKTSTDAASDSTIEDPLTQILVDRLNMRFCPETGFIWVHHLPVGRVTGLDSSDGPVEETWLHRWTLSELCRFSEADLLVLLLWVGDIPPVCPEHYFMLLRGR